MRSHLDGFFNDTYAYGKLCEFVNELFVGLAPARVNLSNHLHFVGIISPTDFRQKQHQELWADLQNKLLTKTKNIGSERAPVDRITVRNKTLTSALESIWSIYEECCTNIS